MNARISPISTSLLVFGVIFLGLLPPVGMVLLLASWLVQREYRGRVLAVRDAAARRAEAKRRREQLAAGRAMLR